MCILCNEVIKKGSVIEKTPHDYVDGKCRICGAVDPDYDQTASGENSQNTNAPNTGDSSNMMVAALILFACMIAISGSIVYMKK